MKRPFQVAVGSQSSELMWESEVGLRPSTTRQYSGSAGWLAPAGAPPPRGAGAAFAAGAAAGAPAPLRPPRPTGAGGVTSSAVVTVTVGMDNVRRLSHVAALAGVASVAKARVPTQAAVNISFMEASSVEGLGNYGVEGRGVNLR